MKPSDDNVAYVDDAKLMRDMYEDKEARERELLVKKYGKAHAEAIMTNREKIRAKRHYGA